MKLEVSEEEINSQIARMAHAYNRRPERLRMELEENHSLEQVATAIVEDKAAQGIPAITSTASAPPTPTPIIPSPPALGVWESVPIMSPPGKA